MDPIATFEIRTFASKRGRLLAVDFTLGTRSAPVVRTWFARSGALEPVQAEDVAGYVRNAVYHAIVGLVGVQGVLMEQ